MAPQSGRVAGAVKLGILLPSLLLLLQAPQLGGRRPGGPRDAAADVDAPPEPSLGRHEFHFTRASYGGWGWRSWATDYPKADRQFLIGIRRILDTIHASPEENPVRLDDPRLARFPFLYAVEVGFMSLSDGEVSGLRRYLLAGGFLVVDDFWGSAEWANFESEMLRVLPEHQIVDLPLDHPLFHAFYDIEELVQVPNVGQGIRGGPTWERDGFQPHCRGILDAKGRLMVVINWNTDLGDAWEWAEQPRYPLKFSNFAYKMGVNMIVYGMSH